MLYKTPPKGVYELWDRVSEQLTIISSEVCQNLIESMLKRIKTALRAKKGVPGSKNEKTCLKCKVKKLPQ